MKRLRAAASLLLLWSSACASGAPLANSDGRGGAAAAASSGQLTVAGGGAACTAPPRSTKASPERDAAVDAFTSGSLRRAIDALEARVKKEPSDIAAQALLVASKTRAALASKRAAAALERLSVKTLAPLDGAQRTNKPLSVAKAGAPLKLERLTDTPVAVLSSTEDWMKKNGLTPRTKFPRAEDLPDGAPQALGARANRLFSHADHEIVRYGEILLVVAPGKAPLLFDVKALDEVHFAQVVGRALVVAAWRNGYAKDVGGRTGQVAAFSIEDGSLIWASEALVATMGGFVVTRDHIVTGYGFTAEPDNLFALELATGKTVQKLPLRSGPEVILQNGDRVFVRTYDSQASFKLTPEPGPAPKAELADAPATSARMSPESACWVQSAVAAIDARDTAALAKAVDGLKGTAADPDVAGAFDGVQLFLQQQGTAAKAIDLTTVTAKRLPKPPWVYTMSRAATAPVTGKPRLVQRASRNADPARDIRRRGARVEPNQPFFLAPVDMGQLPPGARPDIPSTYGLETLRAFSPCADGRLVLVYGGRYVAVVKGSDTEAVFDLENWLTPPRVSAEWKEFAVSEATFGIVEGDVLYIANGGGSYAREMGGSKGYMSAIDIKTGELLWRSQPLVTGPGTFAMHGGYLMTGYGFTAEGDNVFLLRKDTGQVVAKLPVKSAPTGISVSGSVGRVETYDASVEVEIVE